MQKKSILSFYPIKELFRYPVYPATVHYSSNLWIIYSLTSKKWDTLKDLVKKKKFTYLL